MTDPWAVLGLSPDTDEQAIRHRYLELVRQHPPDRDADRFQKIRAAYDALRDPVQRLHRQIFSLEVNRSIEDISADVQARIKQKRISTNLLLSLGKH